MTKIILSFKDKYILHFYELDKNDPVCEGICQEGGDKASINGEKSEGRYLRVPLYLVNQDLEVILIKFFLATL